MALAQHSWIPIYQSRNYPSLIFASMAKLPLNRYKHEKRRTFFID
ncbi:unnamed protein product [Acidithrix sp. C25]|nr:unnamed protein product [Acidithrix sp. C25]